ncbi:hypothetical protein [Curtobacterium sp. MCJR17_043]|nr:hypothetical protein [Curtobacterium sp. MCJR17_043]WIB36652.1 hypothetical protein DEJ15_06050 [Curtobacterium sp. MCJR17_043]
MPATVNAVETTAALWASSRSTAAAAAPVESSAATSAGSTKARLAR